MTLPDHIARRLRKWRWPPLASYAGFTSEERIRAWQLQWLLVDLGFFNRPTRCSITGSTDRVGLHDENYHEPWIAFPISASAHSTLHRRFKSPQPWLDLVAKHRSNGDEWFCHLSLEPLDLAAELRHRHGPGVTNIFAAARARWPIDERLAGRGR